jgi:magnesium chelatase family protein
LGDVSKQCQCSPQQIKNYLGKLSGPLLDRIDIHIEMSRLDSSEIKSLTKKYTNQTQSQTESQSQKTRARIIQAQKFSAGESQGYKLNKEALELLDSSVVHLKLSARAHQKIIRIARTIANLAQSPIISAEHLAEALQFRSINWESFGG